MWQVSWLIYRTDGSNYQFWTGASHTLSFLYLHSLAWVSKAEHILQKESNNVITKLSCDVARALLGTL